MVPNLLNSHKFEVMDELIDFRFQGGSHECLSVTSSGARWVSRINKKSFKFNKELSKDALKYLMSNCYFTFGEKIFHQAIGIPMGSDPAPYIVNIFLYYYDSKTNLHKARMFTNTFRFIDDL